MVGIVNLVIDFGLEWLKIVRAKNVVDAEIHPVFVIGDSRTVTACYVAVCQLFLQCVVGEADGAVIEVATQNDGHVSVHICLYVGCDFLHLR